MNALFMSHVSHVFFLTKRAFVLFSKVSAYFSRNDSTGDKKVPE
jgi:hypothetical protein